MDQKETDCNTPKNDKGGMNNLLIRLNIPPHIAEICYKSIKIETKSEALSRSEVNLSYQKDSLGIEINSKDLTALRAALNTYLRWIIMCCELTENGIAKTYTG